MSTTIKIKRGLKANLPVLSTGELAYCTDTNEVFIGTDLGNELVNPETDLTDYLTETEINNLLAGKSDTGHTHVEADITDLDKYTQNEVDTLLNGKSNTGHTHTESDITDLDKYTTTEVDDLLADKADLDVTGKVPASQLPSFVDDVLEFTNLAGFPATGETGKIYVTLDTNKTYRWSGSQYTEISAGVSLGETSETAYRGDRGKIAYDHSQVVSGNPHNVTLSELGYVAPTPYSHPTYAGDDINIDTGALTGATVISDLDFNITTDTLGHVTDANATVATRTLTLANLGYTPPGEGQITIQGTTGLAGNGAFNVNQAGNQTITLTHADTSSQASINNSNGTVIQDVTLDAYGHITGLGSANLDSRYYTESESDSRFVNASGDTMTGTLSLDRISSRGTEIYIGAGEALSSITGTAEQVYIAGESGVSVHASSDNLSSGLNRSAQLIDTAGNASWGSGSITAGTFIGSLSGTASNASLLDNINSTQFLRSDTTDTMSGRLEMGNVLDMNNYDIDGVDQIFHHGDTNTYMHFHASDQWRVVTGGAERLEVNNSAVTVSNKLVGKINEVNNNVGINFWTGTQAQYDAIGTKSSTTLYFVTE